MAVHSAWLDRVREQLWSRSELAFIPDRDLPAPTGTHERHGGGPRVLFAGFPSDYSLAFLLALLELDVDLVGIITSPGAHPAILGDNALSRIADHLGIPLLRLWRVNDDHSRQDLTALAAEAVVMASFDQIVRGRALAIPTHGWLNIHPSLLPEYRGPEPVYWAVADGAAESGITLHRAVAAVDAGPVLARAAVPVLPDDSAGTLTRRVTAAGVEQLSAALGRLLADDPGEPIDPAAGSYRPSIGHRCLAYAGSAAAAERMVRAGIPNMHAWAEVDGRSQYVLAAHISATEGDLRFPDGGLVLDETAPACGCHHDLQDCPHRELDGIPEGSLPR